MTSTDFQREKEEYIRHLELIPHPEGGYYRETYRSSEMITTTRGQRSTGTVIFFMLESDNFSSFHRLGSDETWYFHAGQPTWLYLLSHDKGLTQYLVGSPIKEGGVLQVTIPAGTWFAAEVADGGVYTLISCSVSPGFEFSEFEMASSEALMTEFPEQAELAGRLCRK